MRRRPTILAQVAPFWATLLAAATFSVCAETLTVTRSLPAASLTTTAQLQVNLAIDVGGDPPTGFVLTELPPQGWSIVAATWHDHDLAPAHVDGRYKWLFGFDEPATSGTLTYVVEAPSGVDPGQVLFSGSQRWFQDSVPRDDDVSGDTVLHLVAPTVVHSVTVEDARSVSVTFTAPVSDSETALDPERYSLTGTGRGSLSLHPDSVSSINSYSCLLSWLTGEMHTGGDIVITTAGVTDTNGHPIGDPDQGRADSAGIGSPPSFTAIVADPALAAPGETVSLSFTASEELIEPPTVTIDGQSADLVSQNGAGYTFTHAVSEAAEPDFAEIAIAGMDTADNRGSAIAADVLRINAPPTVSGDPPLIVTVGEQYSFEPELTDADIGHGDSVSFAIWRKPSWAVFDTATGRVSGTPTVSNVGTTENIVITCADSKGATDAISPFDIIVANIPTATVRGIPPGRTRQTDYSVRVGGASIVTYRWKLDGGDWQGPTAVADPIVLNALPEGGHRLLVLGTNDLGKEQPDEAATAVGWVIDLTPPVAELINAPAAATNSASLDVRVGGAQVQFYKFKLDADAWGTSRARSVAVSAAELADGLHTLSAIGLDAAGNWQSEAAATTIQWTVDTSLPAATVANVPPDVMGAPAVSVKVSGDGVMAYKYMIDAPQGSALPVGWSSQQPVGVPIEFEADVDGDYTLVVNGRNALGTWQDGGAGNTLDRATSHAWTLDRTPPAQLTDLQADLGLPPTSVVELQWTPLGGDVVRYEIRYAKAPWPDWDDATPVYVNISPSDPAEVDHEVFRIRRLAANSDYVFAARAVDAAGNPGAIATAAETTADARPAILDFGIGEGLVKEADNSAARDLRVVGKNFVAGEANTVRFVATGRSFDVPSRATSTAATLDVTVPAGVPVGSYNLRVINANGRSTLSVDVYTVLAAPVPLPEVTNLDPPMVPAGQTAELRIEGANLTGATKVELVAGGTVAFTHDGAMTITADNIDASLALPGDLDPGLYHVRVTTPAGTNQASTLRLEVYEPIDIGAADGSTVASRSVDMPDDGRVPVGLTLTTETGDESGTASDSQAAISASIQPDTQISLTNGQPYTGTVDPPREVPVTDDIAAQIEDVLGFDADSAVVFTMGSATERLELGDGQVMFVTVEISLLTESGPPSVYYLEAGGTLTLAGVAGVHNGIVIVPGGTVLESKPDSPEPGYTSLDSHRPGGI